MQEIAQRQQAIAVQAPKEEVRDTRICNPKAKEHGKVGKDGSKRVEERDPKAKAKDPCSVLSKPKQTGGMTVGLVAMIPVCQNLP